MPLTEARKKKHAVQQTTDRGWPSIKEYAAKWSKLTIPPKESPWHAFTKGRSKINGKETAFGKIDKNLQEKYDSKQKVFKNGIQISSNHNRHIRR